MRTAICSLLLLLLLSLPSTAADSDSVKYWLPHCKALVDGEQTGEKAAYLAGQCLGMIKASSFAIQAATPGGLPFRACLPDNAISETQLVSVILRWMEKKPKLAGESFIVVTMLAMAATWPCK